MSKYTHKAPHSLTEILRHTALPFFLFTMVLTVLLLISWFALIPELTHVEIAGEKRGLQEIKTYRDDLASQIADREAQRDTFLMPVQDPLFMDLRKQKMEMLAFMDLRSDIRRVAQNVHPASKDAVGISLFTVDIDDREVQIQGNVQNVGPRSMTVLAEFIDSVRALPGIGLVESSKFTRKEDPERGFYSPFSLAIFLHDE